MEKDTDNSQHQQRDQKPNGASTTCTQTAKQLFLSRWSHPHPILKWTTLSRCCSRERGFVPSRTGLLGPPHKRVYGRNVLAERRHLSQQTSRTSNESQICCVATTSTTIRWHQVTIKYFTNPLCNSLIICRQLLLRFCCLSTVAEMKCQLTQCTSIGF